MVKILKIVWDQKEQSCIKLYGYMEISVYEYGRSNPHILAFISPRIHRSKAQRLVMNLMIVLFF